MTTQPESVTLMETDTSDMSNVSVNFTEDIAAFDWNASLRRPPIGPRRLPPPRDPVLVQLMLFQYYGYPVIFSVGTLGNILSYLVFTRSRLKKVSSVHYLAAMAITDTGFLWTFFLTPMHSFYNIPIIVQDGLCQFMTFLNYVFTFLSIWYLVALVVEKFIGVYFPLQKSTMCTPFRAKLVMSFMAVVAVACYSYVVYFFGPDKVYGMLQCMPWAELRVHFDNLSKIDTFVIAIIPYGVIIMLLFLILLRSCEYYRISASSELMPHPTGRSGTQSACHVARIVYPMVILTMMSNLPVMITRMAMTIHGIMNQSTAKWNQIFYVIYIFNFAIKYFVYVLFSSNFRSRTGKLLKVGYERLRKICRQKTSRGESDPHRITMEQVNGKTKRTSIAKADI